VLPIIFFQRTVEDFLVLSWQLRLKKKQKDDVGLNDWQTG